MQLLQKMLSKKERLPLLQFGKSGGPWFYKPISKANADKLGEKATKHQASCQHEHAESLASQCQSQFQNYLMRLLRMLKTQHS